MIDLNSYLIQSATLICPLACS